MRDKVDVDKMIDDAIFHLQQARELDQKSHKRLKDVVWEADKNKMWSWCMTHERFEKIRWFA